MERIDDAKKTKEAHGSSDNDNDDDHVYIYNYIDDGDVPQIRTQHYENTKLTVFVDV